MSSRSAMLPLVLFAAGCMRSLPPMPGVTVVSTVGAARAPALEVEPGPAAEEGADDSDAEADYAAPCKEGSLLSAAAEVAFEAFAKKVRALPVRGDPKPLEEELEVLLDHPCFELARADPKELFTFPNAVSMRSWWVEGGADWLWSYLRAAERRYLRVAPTPRVALTVETASKDHPLRPLLCPADESVPCATESAGWARRANEKLELVAQTRRHGKDEVACADEVAKEPKAERYAAYRDCLESGFLRRHALPIGRFKAPADGWLVIDDDNGSCRHLRAFDLANGSTYITENCSSAVQTTVGRVPVGALREAAWMLVLARETQANVRPAQGYHVPEAIPIKRTRGETIGLGLIGCGCNVSSQRSWSWMRTKNGSLRGQISGTVLGRADDDALRHAYELLDVAEAAFEKGCASSAPPARIEWSSPGPSSKGTDAAVLDDVASEPVRAALAKARPPRACTAKP